MSYEVKRIDLGAIQAQDQQLVPPSKRISEIVVFDMPVGAAFNLKIGASNPYIPLTRPFTMEPTGDDENNNGLFWTNDTAQAGITVVMLISYGGAQLQPVLT